MNIKLLTEHHLECLSLKEGCTGLSESTLVKIPHCWKPHLEDLRNKLPLCFIIPLYIGMASKQDFGTYRICANVPVELEV